MKVLLDECVPERFSHYLQDHDLHSAKYAGLNGLKNGELLRLASQAGYDVLVTVDQGIPFQNKMSGQSVAVIVLSAPRNDIDILKCFASSVERALATIAAGQILTLNYSGTLEDFPGARFPVGSSNAAAGAELHSGYHLRRHRSVGRDPWRPVRRAETRGHRAGVVRHALRLLNLDQLIRAKRAAGRPRDVEALAELEAIQEER